MLKNIVCSLLFYLCHRFKHTVKCTCWKSIGIKRKSTRKQWEYIGSENADIQAQDLGLKSNLKPGLELSMECRSVSAQPGTKAILKTQQTQCSISLGGASRNSKQNIKTPTKHKQHCISFWGGAAKSQLLDY